NGKKITDPRSLQLQIAQNAPGSKVDLRVLRSESGGKAVEKNITATLAELPAEALAAMGGGRNTPEEGGGKQNMDVLDGVEVTDIDATARRELNIPRALRGALVTNVAPDSNAAEAGL